MSKSFLSCFLISVSFWVNLCFDRWFCQLSLIAYGLFTFFGILVSKIVLRLWEEILSLLLMLSSRFLVLLPLGWWYRTRSYLEVPGLGAVSVLWRTISGASQIQSELACGHLGSILVWRLPASSLPSQAHLWTAAAKPQPQVAVNSRSLQLPSPFTIFSFGLSRQTGGDNTWILFQKGGWTLCYPTAWVMFSMYSGASIKTEKQTVYPDREL